MSCRISVNMAKRAAAGAMKSSVRLDDEIDGPPTVQIPISLRQHGSSRAIAQKRHPARVFAMGLSLLVALSFISYATYVHQWLELSALRHLGNGPLANELSDR
jgi:hypothetical protein